MTKLYDPSLHDVIKAQPWQHASFLAGAAGKSQAQKQLVVEPAPADDPLGVGPIVTGSPQDEAASDPPSSSDTEEASGASEFSPRTPEQDLDGELPVWMVQCWMGFCLSLLPLELRRQVRVLRWHPATFSPLLLHHTILA